MRCFKNTYICPSKSVECIKQGDANKATIKNSRLTEQKENSMFVQKAKKAEHKLFPNLLSIFSSWYLKVMYCIQR
jgi:hypothetical protein